MLLSFGLCSSVKLGNKKHTLPVVIFKFMNYGEIHGCTLNQASNDCVMKCIVKIGEVMEIMNRLCSCTACSFQVILQTLKSLIMLFADCVSSGAAFRRRLD